MLSRSRKKLLFRPANAIFGKVGRTASEEVTLDTKFIAILICGLERFSLPKSDLKSLDLAVTRFLMKLFRLSNVDVIADCQRYLDSHFRAN